MQRGNVKRTAVLIALPIVLVALIVAGIAHLSPDQGQRRGILPTVLAAPSTTTCDPLVGAYRYTFSGFGFHTANAIGPAGPSAPFAAAGLATFSSNGTLSGADTASVGGLILNRTYTGTYTLNSNCTGTITLSFCPGGCFGPANIVVALDESEILFINTIGGTTVLGNFKKQ